MFDKIAAVLMAILGNSITFTIALITIIFWLTNKRFCAENIHSRIGDAILGIIFLSLFIIQKSFHRFSASLYLQVHELVSSHETAGKCGDQFGKNRNGN